MPIVQMPDGARIEFPDGTSPEVMTRALQAFASSRQPAQQGPGMLETAARAAGQLGAGFNERLAQTLGALPDLYNRGLRAVGLPAMPEGAYTQGIQGGINAVVGQPAAPDGTLEQLARGAGHGIVDTASVALPAAGAARVATAAGQGGSLAGRLTAALAQQPAMQAAAGMTGGAVGEATDSPLTGTAAALATPLVAALGRRAITPIPAQNSPGRAALVQAADREGIPLTAGQATGSRTLQNIESQLEQLPLTAAPQRAIREEQNRQFIRAAMERAGETATDTGPATLNAARNRIGTEIGAIANRNVLQVTPALEGRLQQIEDSLRFVPPEAATPVQARIDQLRGMVIQPPAPPPGTMAPPGGLPNPTVPGASYRMLDSELGRSIRNTSDGDRRAALTQLRQELRTAMDASISRQDAAAWARARREYANLMVIAQAAGRAGAGAAEGTMSPVALRQALDRSTGGGYVYGRGDLNELARVGQGLLRPPPDSGTAGRSYANALLTGGLASGGAGAGALAGGPLGAAVGAGASLAMPRLVQMLMNSDAGQRYLRNQLLPNRVATPGLAAALLAQQGVSQAVQP